MTTSQARTVICSHGFGSDKTAGGLFTDIAAAFPGNQFVMANYNRVDKEGNTHVPTLAAQVAMLQKLIDAQPHKVTLLAHSQGCVVASLINLSKVEQVILLAPPDENGIQFFTSMMSQKYGVSLDTNAAIKLPKGYGTQLVLPAGYANSFAKLPLLKLYTKIVQTAQLSIFKASNDEVVGQTNFEPLNHLTLQDNHSFSLHRNALLSELKPLL